MALGLVAAPTRGRGEPLKGLGFNWVRLEGAEECVSSVELMNRIEARADRILFVRAGDATLTLDGYVSPISDKREWRVALQLSDAEGRVLGRRELRLANDGDCAVVRDAAELIFDLTLDPDGLFSAGIALEPETQRLLDELLRGEPLDPDPAALPVASRPGRAEPAEPHEGGGRAPASTRPQVRVATSPARHVAVALSGLATLGPLPDLSPGTSLRVALPLHPEWLVELVDLGLIVVPAASAQILGARPGGADFQRFVGSLSACFLRPVAALRLCAGGEYGQQRAAPTGFRTPRDSSSQHVFNAAVHSALRVGLYAPLSLRASVALTVPVVRQTYTYETLEGERRLFREAPLGGRMELGLELAL